MMFLMKKSLNHAEMINSKEKRLKVCAWLALGLGLAQLAITLTAWLLTAAWPEEFTRSFLSAEGIRWLFGKFQENLATPALVWLVVCSIAWGAYRESRIWDYDRREYRQRFAMGVAIFEGVMSVLVMLLLTMLPHAILLNVMGGLFPSSFSHSIIPYVAISVTIACCSFGLISGRVHGIEGVFAVLTSGIERLAPLFVLYVLGTQLYYSILYLM